MLLSHKDTETERLARERRKRGEADGLAGRMDALAREGAALADLDRRSAEEIIGYGAHGLPG
jgi:hypothetical protein